MTQGVTWPELFPDVTFYATGDGTSVHVGCRWECACDVTSGEDKPLSPALEDVRLHNEDAHPAET